MAKIHIIEDDETLRDELERLLSLQGFDVHTTRSFDSLASVVAEIEQVAPDCLVLDLKLPSPDKELSGHAICREVCSASQVPIIVLTSVTDEFDEVMAFNLGATDYVAKPYRPAALIARIQSVLKTADGGKASGASHVLSHGGLQLDLDSSTAAFEGRTAVLTRNEQAILAMLMEAPGTIVARQELMCRLWESDQFVDDNTLTVNVNRLRSTLERIGVPADFIRTRRGQGYIL